MGSTREIDGAQGSSVAELHSDRAVQSPAVARSPSPLAAPSMAKDRLEVINARPLRSGKAPEWMDEDDDRVTCEGCVNRSRDMCVTLKLPCFPFDLKHRCEFFSKRLGVLTK